MSSAVPPPPGEQGPQRQPARRRFGAPPPPVPGDVRRTGFLPALAATALWAGVSLVLLLVVAGPPDSAEAVGTVIGTLGFSAVLAAVPTWIVVRRRPGGWPFWQVVLLALGFYLLVRIVLVAGSTAGSGA